MEGPLGQCVGEAVPAWRDRWVSALGKRYQRGGTDIQARGGRDASLEGPRSCLGGEGRPVWWDRGAAPLRRTPGSPAADAVLRQSNALEPLLAGQLRPA